MTVIEIDGGESEPVSRWYRERCGPLITADGSPVALGTGFLARRAADPRKGAGPPDHAGDADDLVVLWFCDADPAAEWDDLLSAQGRIVEASGVARVVWASPFVTTVVGTDTYMDQL